MLLNLTPSTEEQIKQCLRIHSKVFSRFSSCVAFVSHYFYKFMPWDFKENETKALHEAMSRTRKTEAVGDLKSPVKFSPLRARYDNRNAITKWLPLLILNSTAGSERKHGVQLW